MAASQTSKVVLHLRGVVQPHDGVELTDGQLLECFVERQDESAFAGLVGRHGPMVWGVCRRLLTHHDAEDAFQATFLVLARKAAAVAPRELLANWLYGVAHQTALQARRTASRRRAREMQVVEMPDPGSVPQELWGDLRPLLDQELSRLPDNYRSVIVLCELEGKTRTEAARLLGVAEGTVAGRLARARTRLAERLARRGLKVSSGVLAVVLSEHVASAGVPASVVTSTIRAAALSTAGGAAAGAVRPEVLALMEGVLKTMLLTKLKAIAVVALMVAALAVGLGLTYHAPAADPVPAPAPKNQAAPAPGAVTAVKADPTVQDLSTALGITWWKFDLEKEVRAVELGILEGDRFTRIERYDLQPGADVPGPLKIAYQDDGSPEFKLTVITKGGTLRTKGDKPADFMRTRGTAIKNGEYLELGSFKQSQDKGWKYALVIKVVEKAD